MADFGVADELEESRERQRRMQAVRDGQEALRELPIVEKILTERQEAIVAKIEDALENRADSRTLKDELHGLCIALHEARGLWQALQITAEQGVVVGKELDEELRAQTGPEEG